LWYSKSGPADFGISPIDVDELYFWSSGEVEIPHYRPHVCPGTPLTFYTGWQVLPRYRTELEIDAIRLADYQLNDSWEGMESFGVSVP
jgi:hypothetical protein